MLLIFYLNNLKNNFYQMIVLKLIKIIIIGLCISFIQLQWNFRRLRNEVETYTNMDKNVLLDFWGV